MRSFEVEILLAKNMLDEGWVYSLPLSTSSFYFIWRLGGNNNGSMRNK